LPVAVVDASAIAAILFGEPAADDIVERLGSSQLAAPSLLPYEIVSVASGRGSRARSKRPTRRIRRRITR